MKHSLTEINFAKFNSTGNDFIIIDSIYKNLKLSTTKINNLCNRHTGIGADGLILIRESKVSDFKMVYYNSDGKIGSMCGNGARASVFFAFQNKIINNSKATFEAYDGIHFAKISQDKDQSAIVSVTLNNLNKVTQLEKNLFFLDTGSPHLVVVKDEINSIDVYNKGKELRNLEILQPNGANVNFICKYKTGIQIRTFERGVENETLSCGTGVTAASIVWAEINNLYGKQNVDVSALGGNLGVSFIRNPDDTISNIKLTGKTKIVFTGNIIL